MLPRHDLVLIFSSYASFEGGNFRQWLIATRLKQNFQQLLASKVVNKEEQTGEIFWSLYLFKYWQEHQDKCSQSHLEAYLQEPCYWAAKSFVFYVDAKTYSIADCFQTAMAETLKVLRGFKPTVGQKLGKYAQYCFSNLLREHFRCQGEVDICTDWALLRKISEKTFRAALSGQTSTTLLSFTLCWKCFKQVYTPAPGNTRKLEAPDRAVLETIVQLYNSRILEEREQLIRLSSGEMALQWFQQWAKAIRRYLQPPVSSLNVSRPDQEGELQDIIKDPNVDDDLTEVLIQQESYKQREQHKQAMVSCLTKTIGNLDAQSQGILGGYYHQQLTQQELSRQFKLSQPTVNRRLNKARQTLLQELVKWMAEEVNISVTPDLLTHSADLLEEWLHQYYGAQL